MPTLRPAALAPLALALALGACNASGDAAPAENSTAGSAGASGRPFVVEEVARLNEPWAMTFLPNSTVALVTEKSGTIRIVDTGSGRIGAVSGVPSVDYGGQGGLGDIVLHPKDKSLVYLSFAEGGPNGTRGAAVGRGRLVCQQSASCQISGFEVIWRQSPKMSGRGHYGHRIAFSPDGHLFISSGDRQEFTPAQDMNANLGKILRLKDDGSIPADNPFASRGGVAAQIWSLGHRNPLGIAFAADGRLWENEMGPQGGDEFNLIERGSNYGYPIVSNGDHYGGKDIPDHSTRPEFNAPEITWTPVISPSSMIFYTGSAYPGWRGSALIGGLSSKALIRVTISGNTAREAQRWAMGERIREVEQGPDGIVYVLEDGKNARLLRLRPAR